MKYWRRFWQPEPIPLPERDDPLDPNADATQLTITAEGYASLYCTHCGERMHWSLVPYSSKPFCDQCGKKTHWRNLYCTEHGSISREPLFQSERHWDSYLADGSEHKCHQF